MGKGAARFEPGSGQSISVLECYCGVHCYNFISFIAWILIARFALNLFAIRLNNEHTYTHDNCRLFVSFVSCARGTAAIDFPLRCIRAAWLQLFSSYFFIVAQNGVLLCFQLDQKWTEPRYDCLSKAHECRRRRRRSQMRWCLSCASLRSKR